MYTVSYTIDKTCNLNALNYQIGQYMYKANMTLVDVQNNFLKNIFSVVGSTNAIAEVLWGWDVARNMTDLKSTFT